jgi:hypothetical protein
MCCSHHTHCREPKSKTSFPTRVIDGGPPDGSLEPMLLKSNHMKDLYVTLSHCPGGKVSSTTTPKNVEEHNCAISLNTLPNTFQDAILITRRLGLRYLWIDSLCILQGSASDWQRGSAVMHGIDRTATSLSLREPLQTQQWDGFSTDLLSQPLVVYPGLLPTVVRQAPYTSDHQNEEPAVLGRCPVTDEDGSSRSNFCPLVYCTTAQINCTVSAVKPLSAKTDDSMTMRFTDSITS